MTRLRRLITTASLPAAALLATACEVRTTVAVHAGEDGSGRVEVAVGLDDEAVAELPDLDGDGRSATADLAALVRTDDLAAAGWSLSEPAEGEGGLTWVRATKPFGTPAEANVILDELTGPDGPLGSLRLARSDGFTSTEVELTGDVDLSGGLEAFGDEGLAQVLDGEPLGEDAAAIEERLGRPLDEAFRLDLVAELPGAVDANTDERADGAPVWSPRLGGEPVEVEATATQRDLPVLLLMAVAVASAVGLVVLVVRRVLAARGETRGETGGDTAEAKDA